MIKIKFKYTPSAADRETLKLSGFVYDKHHKVWAGADTEYNRLLLRTFKEENNGTVTLLGMV